MTMSWRQRVGDLHLAVWDRLVAHTRGDSPDPLPPDMQPWDAQQALLYVAQAKGFVVLSGMGTDKPRIRLTEAGEAIWQPLMTVVQGNMVQGNMSGVAEAVSVIDGTAADLTARVPAEEDGAVPEPPEPPPGFATGTPRRPAPVPPPIAPGAPRRPEPPPQTAGAPRMPEPPPQTAGAPRPAPLHTPPQAGPRTAGEAHWPQQFRRGPEPPPRRGGADVPPVGGLEPPPPQQPSPPQPKAPDPLSAVAQAAASLAAGPLVRQQASGRCEDNTERHIWKLLKAQEDRRRTGEAEQVVIPGPTGAPGAIAWVPAGMSSIVQSLDIHMSRVRRFQATSGQECLVAPIGAIVSALLAAAGEQGFIRIEHTSQGMSIDPVEGREHAFETLASFSGGPADGDMPGLQHLLDILSAAG